MEQQGPNRKGCWQPHVGTLKYWAGKWFISPFSAIDILVSPSRFRELVWNRAYWHLSLPPLLSPGETRFLALNRIKQQLGFTQIANLSLKSRFSRGKRWDKDKTAWQNLCMESAEQAENFLGMGQVWTSPWQSFNLYLWLYDILITFLYIAFLNKMTQWFIIIHLNKLINICCATAVNKGYI